VSIGREEGNTIQLNDERISRFHAKIQEDQDKLILTDLESTNGTKVNGEDVQLRILRYGDVISLGRSVLVYGSREQIAGRLHTLRRAQPADGPEPPSLDAELSWSQDPKRRSTRSCRRNFRSDSAPGRRPNSPSCSNTFGRGCEI
jgi:predicted component of type VI protein secretion system